MEPPPTSNSVAGLRKKRKIDASTQTFIGAQAVKIEQVSSEDTKEKDVDKTIEPLNENNSQRQEDAFKNGESVGNNISGKPNEQIQSQSSKTSDVNDVNDQTKPPVVIKKESTDVGELQNKTNLPKVEKNPEMPVGASCLPRPKPEATPEVPIDESSGSGLPNTEVKLEKESTPATAKILQINEQNPLVAFCKRTLIAERIRKLELTNFMNFSEKVVNFHAETFVTGPISSGKSAITIGILLALGQDSILKYYGYELKDLIQNGSEIAVLKLTVSTALGTIRDIFGDVVHITRKIQLQDGQLLPPLWRVKAGESCPGFQARKFQYECEIIEFISELEIKPWNDGVPYLITQELLNDHLDHSSKYWYDEFARMFKQQFTTELKSKGKLESELEALYKTRKENGELLFHLTKNYSTNKIKIEELRDVNEKRRRKILIKEREYNTIKSVVLKHETNFINDFEKFFKDFSTAMRLPGLCCVDCKSEEITFALHDHNDKEPFLKHSLLQNWTISSLRCKRLGIATLIMCFWFVFDISPFHIIETSFEDVDLRMLFRSKVFAEVLAKQLRKQLIVTGHSFD